MSNFMIALLMSVGVGGWIYNKTMKRTGSQVKMSLITAGVVAFLAFLISFSVMSFIEN